MHLPMVAKCSSGVILSVASHGLRSLSFFKQNMELLGDSEEEISRDETFSEVLTHEC